MTNAWSNFFGFIDNTAFALGPSYKTLCDRISVTKEQMITKGQFACRIAAQIDVSHNVPLLGDY